MINFSEEYIKNHWSNQEPIRLRGKTWRVGKMSYGEYFLEQKKDWKLTENDYHSKDTLWLTRFINNLKQVCYRV